ncbi:uncharacterized protein V1518DRAFT_412197 [Limtongia smithiae]|uniref:uncharacterized protein n=1 Tax=Limtongia smithiae TaxID=1125753 RepID=UPI0034CD8811
MASPNDPVIVSLADLSDGTADSHLVDAFGPDSLGIIVVKGLPARFIALRSQLLFFSSQLASLPPAVLEGLESPESHYLVGWSCGHEKLLDGQPDTLKGSYYANCSFYVDPNLEGAEVIENGRWPMQEIAGYATPNLWPSERAMAGFQTCFKEMIKIIIDTAVLVAQACDRYCVANVQDYTSGYLEHIVKTSTTTKARLLHYFPVESTATHLKENWCGEHLDHGCLTGLTSAMFIDERTAPDTELVSSPDPESGLYIRNRHGEIIKVNIPKDCLAFQTGQALQVVTNNQFRAVPHFVKGSQVPGICRNTLAVFCQPSLHEMVGADDFATFARNIVTGNIVQ